MKYIVIGPDGSGKTTFCKKFSEKYGFKYIKCSNLEDNKKESAMELLSNGKDTVFDRFYYPDEPIYQALKANNDVIDTRGWEQVICELKHLNVTFLYLDQPLDVLESRLGSRGDDFISINELSKIKELYENWIANCDIPVIRINV